MLAVGRRSYLVFGSSSRQKRPGGRRLLSEHMVVDGGFTIGIWTNPAPNPGQQSLRQDLGSQEECPGNGQNGQLMSGDIKIGALSELLLMQGWQHQLLTVAVMSAGLPGHSALVRVARATYPVDIVGAAALTPAPHLGTEVSAESGEG